MSHNAAPASDAKLPTDEEFSRLLAAIVAAAPFGCEIHDVRKWLQPFVESDGGLQFRNYLAHRFGHFRKEKFSSCSGAVNPNQDHVTINSEILRKASRRFRREDRLSLSFDFNDDWSRVYGMSAAWLVRGMNPLEKAIWIALSPFLIVGDVLEKRRHRHQRRRPSSSANTADG